jgi:hypothetical protein
MSASANGGTARPDIQIMNSDETVSVGETVAVIFYSRMPHLDMRDAVAASIRDFAALVSFKALTSYGDYEGNEEDLDAQTLEDVIQERFYAPGHFPNANITLVGGGFHARDFYLWYSGTAISNPELPDEASFLWCWVPRRFFLENRARVMSFAESTSARLPHTFGYVSPALAGENRWRKQAIGQRHPGLDLASPLSIATDIAGQAAGAYWVNYLGADLTTRLGGSDAIRAALPSDVIVEDLGGNRCRVTLGTEPELGDVNRRDLLPAYRAFAALLDSRRTLAMPMRVVYFVDADNAADREAMERWHRRFLT